MMQNIPFKILGVLAGLSFMLNLIWEFVQAPLYAGFDGFLPHFMMCFQSAWGDIAMVFLIYLALAIGYKDVSWAARPTTRQLLLSGLIGLLFAIVFEQYALKSHRWTYTASMPVFSFLNVGITPLLQMLILTPLAFFLTSKFLRKRQL